MRPHIDWAFQIVSASCRDLQAGSLRSPEFSAGPIPRREILVPRSGVRMRRTNYPWLQRNRLKTGNRNWNGFERGRAEHFLSIHRTTAMARRRWAFVIEIIADSIRIED